MTQIIIDDPDLYEQFEVKDDGRIYLGKDWAGKEVKIAIEEVRDGCKGKSKPTTTVD